jgi:hypothetical protein
LVTRVSGFERNDHRSDWRRTFEINNDKLFAADQVSLALIIASMNLLVIPTKTSVWNRALQEK